MRLCFSALVCPSASFRYRAHFFSGVWKLLQVLPSGYLRNTLSGQGQLLRSSIVGAVGMACEPDFDVLGNVGVRSWMFHLVFIVLVATSSLVFHPAVLVFCYFLRFSQYAGFHTLGLGTSMGWLVLLVFGML